MNQLRTFLYGIGITFGLPWLLLVVVPWFQLRAVEPVPYDVEGGDELKGLYPPAVAHENGRLIYASEGCAHCHTQMVRAPYVGMDAWKLGWGRDQSQLPSEPVRQSQALDYYGEPFAMLGYRRIGPDLANVGWRENSKAGLTAGDRLWHHRHLYDPRSVHDWSTMPSFRHLYRKIPVEGQTLETAVDTVTSDDGTTYQIVPTADAEALVEYLMSLKKAWPLPGEGSGDDNG